MLYLGLTGNIASGKSEVARMFEKLGATIIDADVLAREAVLPGTPGFAQIVARWGDRIVGPDGMIDRAALRKIVFSNAKELDALNAIVHPQVGILRDDRLAQARRQGTAVVIYDVPLLFEAKLADEFDKIILVDAPEQIRLERLMTKRGLSHADAERMIASQMPSIQKRGLADFVIENDKTLAELSQRVTALWQQL